MSAYRFLLLIAAPTFLLLIFALWCAACDLRDAYKDAGEIASPQPARGEGASVAAQPSPWPSCDLAGCEERYVAQGLCAAHLRSARRCERLGNR